MTKVSINETEFYIDGEPTYKECTFEDHNIQGLLFNVRAVQATFDDANSTTRVNWKYPDTGNWDPNRNTLEFCANLPLWKAHGILAATVNFQGGGPLYIPEIYDTFDNNGFTPEGLLKPDYAERMHKVLTVMDRSGMVAILGMFYVKHANKLQDEVAVWRAAKSTMDFLRSGGYQNVLVEIANENSRDFNLELLKPEGVHEMIHGLRANYPEFMYASSLWGADMEHGTGLPTPELVEASDYVLLHGNGNHPDTLVQAIEYVRAMPAYITKPKPILINEDSIGVPNLDASWQNYVSWGYYDQGFGGEGGWWGDVYQDFRTQAREDTYEALSGYQTPPVNWGINTEHKKAFFSRVAKVTGKK